MKRLKTDKTEIVDTNTILFMAYADQPLILILSVYTDSNLEIWQNKDFFSGMLLVLFLGRNDIQNDLKCC